MDPKEISKLVQQRGFHKATITRVQNFILKSYDSERHSLYDVKNRLNILTDAFKKFEVVQLTLEINDSDVDHTSHMVDVEEQYLTTKSAIDKIIYSLESLNIKDSKEKCTVKISSSNPLTLPAISLPSFDGDFTNWIHFKDIFENLIVRNDSLSDVQRLHYLNSSLNGEAKDLIRNIPITDTNFSVAWNLVYDRYNNPKLIVQRHVVNLLNLPSAFRESATSLRILLNHIKSNMHAIEALKEVKVPLHELLLSQMLLCKVDVSTKKAWELKATGAAIPTLAELFFFLEERCQSLETLHSNDTRPSIQVGRQSRSSYISMQNMCPLCNQVHTLSKCSKFQSLSLSEKQDIIRKHNLCFNCLRANHNSRNCDSNQGCRICGLRHHTFIHKEKTLFKESLKSDNIVSQENETPDSNNYCSFKGANSEILLATAIVQVRDSIGQLHQCRALLDSASQSNFISETLVQRLRLKKHQNNVPIHGINGIQSQTTHCVTLNIQSMHTPYNRTISCLAISKISSNSPGNNIDISNWDLPTNINLADPSFNQPGRVDLLIGAELYFNLLLPCEKMTNPGHPTLINTELGWILSGSVPAHNYSVISRSRQNFLLRDDNLHDQIQHFWELEEVPQPIIKSENYCEDHFIQNTLRDETGRYVVRLPLKENVAKLGETLQGATMRFLRLERQLSQNQGLRNDYIKFLEEYESLGHMTECVKTNRNESQLTYYLPHHAVFKISSTTRVRVVFDASFKSSSNLSLNDVMHVGPAIQDDLCSIVLRFRTYPVCFTADIEKMYRQIRIHENDCNLQRILWRRNPEDSIKIYNLKTVTYGTAAASFLAIRTLHQLARDEGEGFPDAAKILMRDMYVDNCISGASTVEEAIELQNQLRELLRKGGMHLRKWCSNEPIVLQNIPEEDRETQLPLQFSEEGKVKTLGLLWHPASDNFQISFSIPSREVFTKRNVLSSIAAIFDPLGLISPITILFKIFMQNLWQIELQWDEDLPSELQESWKRLIFHLPAIRDLEIGRLALSKGETSKIQLHGFCDASEKAYGACVYLWSINEEGSVTVKLLFSKSRVAPLKKISLPRLELCAAVILSRLFHKIRITLNVSFNAFYLWTDSTIVLSWISEPPSRWKTFVANRVTEIQALSKEAVWNHVPSQDNPADLISRGVPPNELQYNQLWWNGPSWLIDPSRTFPNSHIKLLQPLLEQRTPTSLLVTQGNEWDILQKFSSLFKLRRIVAYCLRFVSNCRSKTKNKAAISSSELRIALYAVVKNVQKTYFYEDYLSLSSKLELKSSSELKFLNPFIDNDGIIRVGGRLRNANIPFQVKFPIVLPFKSKLTELIAVDEHKKNLHIGQQGLLAAIRQQYWPLRGRDLVKNIIHRCVTCFKTNPKCSTQLMGELPRDRVQACRPFLHVGLDYCGPFFISQGRGRALLKAYVCAFVCFATKAVHLEVVSNLTSDAFIGALRRFIARRGKCQRIYSDNGSNFIGANNELREIRELLQSNNHISKVNEFLLKDNIAWSFIPPRAPHMGGLWEAAIKSFKYHFKRIVGLANLTYEEMTTIVAQIEACLNSRPLLPLTDDPSDLSYLSPSHFLIGDSLNALPECDITERKLSSLTRWQRVQQLQQHFWKRWSKEYLGQLQNRTKWLKQKSNIVPGMMVVVKEDNLPPLMWKLGRIISVIPGGDKLVRVVTVKTAVGEFKRNINRICILPISDNEMLNDVEH